MKKTAKDYYTTHLSVYVAPESRCFDSIEVLEFLKGLPWDDLALQYVHALRPTSIRVTNGEIKCDARIWRVTVFVDSENKIQSIEQEVELGGEYGSGYETKKHLKAAKEGREVDTYNTNSHFSLEAEEEIMKDLYFNIHNPKKGV